MTHKGKKILIVEDELNMRLGLQDNLEYEGYRVSCAETAEQGLELVKQVHPDLILLDVMLPGIDGIEFCKLLRARKYAMPVIMLTVKGHEADKVLGLEVGADDYVTKPFGLRELLARIKAVFRRSEKGGTGEVYSFSGMEVDFYHYKLRKNGIAVDLTAKELELLKYLVEHKDAPVSRETLLNEVWGYDSFPTTRTVDNYILKLRKKIEDAPDSPRHILTVHGVGYKFVD